MYCSPAEKAFKEVSKFIEKYTERPVSGLHFGISGQLGFLKEKGIYLQGDAIVDWKTGTVYRMGTVGIFDVIGTPSGGSLEGYGGTTVVHGIPINGENDISSYLAGKNIDLEGSIGTDAFGKVSISKGLSVDVDDSFKPINTGAGFFQYQYAIENSIELGANVVPNGIEVSGQGGASYSWTGESYQISWWPWR